MRSSKQRIDAYNVRSVSSLLDPARAASALLARRNYAAHANGFVPKQLALRELLNGQRIPTTDFFTYEAFNGQMYHVSRTTAGSAAVTVATALIAKYVAGGADEDLLVQIAGDLWNIIALPAIVYLDEPFPDQPDVPLAGNLSWFDSARATGYDVYLWKDGDPESQIGDNVAGLIQAYAGLQLASEYHFRVVGRNPYGYGASSAVRDFFTILV